jgi:hypothetical protein
MTAMTNAANTAGLPIAGWNAQTASRLRGSHGRCSVFITPVTPALRRLNGTKRVMLLAGLAKSNLERILVTPLFLFA